MLDLHRVTIAIPKYNEASVQKADYSHAHCNAWIITKGTAQPI